MEDKLAKADTVYLTYHDGIDNEKSKTLMEVCSNLVTTYAPTTLYFLFSSGGGSVDSAVTLYHFLKALPCEIIIHNIGSIDSAANVVFMAGDKRYAVSHTSFLFHGLTYGFEPNPSNRGQIEEALSILKQGEDKIVGIVASNSKISEPEVRELFSHGESKSASFALDKGIVNKLMEASVPEGAPLFTVNTSTQNR